MKIKIISILSIAILLSSCSSWIDSSLNTDPNNPSDVAMAQLVAPIEANLAYIAGGELPRFTSTWMQQIAGLQSQSADIDIYNISEADTENAWSWNLYQPGMINTKILMEKAVTNSSPYYGGIAKILMAYHLGVTSDLFGDIPYSDALKGATGQTKSKYDTQQQIYTTIFTLLNGAIADLNGAQGTFKPGAEDLIYGGDKTLWKKTAYALIARYKLHLSKQNGAAAYTDALAAIANSYTSNDDDFKFTFGAAYNNSNPIFQFESERAKYIGANKTFLNLLTDTNDPRLEVYYAGTDTSTVTGVVKLEFIGSASGESNSSASSIGANYASTDSPVYLMSFAELKFIEAEALLSSDAAGAATAYNAGLKASLDREGVYDATWYNANKLTAGTITLEKIINQKYLSGFLQIEVYNDWRRTGFPTLTLATGAVTNQIPRRLPYAQDERLYNNENMPKGLTITSRVWWDKP